MTTMSTTARATTASAPRWTIALQTTPAHTGPLVYEARDAERRVIGFVECWLTGTTVYLTKLSVESESQRQGVGSALVDRVVCEGVRLGARSVLLEVECGNTAAQQF